MSDRPIDKSETFRGLIPFRVAFAACAIFVIALGVAAPWLGPDDQPVDTFREYAGVVVLMAICFVSGAAGLALCLERVVVDDGGVHRRNPIWFDRSTPWNEIASVAVDTDFNTHPAITLVSGGVVRLRGAASLLSTARSTAFRAHEAIEARLP